MWVVTEQNTTNYMHVQLREIKYQKAVNAHLNQEVRQSVQHSDTSRFVHPLLASMSVMHSETILDCADDNKLKPVKISV